MKMGEFEISNIRYFVRGKNNNKLLVHPKGTVGYLLQKAAVNPTGRWAMKGNRHPITEFGIGYFLDRYEKDFEGGVSSGDVSVFFTGSVEVNGERGDKIELVLEDMAKKALYYAPKAIAVFSRKSKLPIDIQIFNDSGEIVEHYQYLNLKSNNGFRDIDFDPRNPAYKF